MTTQLRLIEDDRPAFTFLRIPLTHLSLGVPATTDKTMVESIRQHGLMQPLIVAEVAKLEYVVIAGRRRLAAIQALWLEEHLRQEKEDQTFTDNPWKDVACYVCIGGVYPALTLTENAQRKPNPMVEARAIMALMDTGMGEQEIAMRTGMSAQTQRKRLPLLRLDTALIDGVDDGRIAMGVGEQMTKLTTEQQASLCQTLAEKDTVTAADVRQVKQARQVIAMSTLTISSLFEPDDYLPDWKDEAKMLLRQVETLVPADAPDYLRAAVSQALNVLNDGEDA